MRIVLLLLLVGFAGCVGDTSADTAPRPELAFEGFVLHTTPFEAFEEVGENHIGYAGDLFGIYAEREDDMPRYTVVAPDAVYTSEFLMGWTRHPDIESVPGSRAWRLHAWDVRSLVEEGSYNGTAFSGEIEVRGRLGEYAVTHDPWTIQGDFEAELPYTLTPEPVTLPFPLQVPAGARPIAEVDPLESDARANHARIIQWIRGYVQANAGNVPDSIDEDTLVLQRLGSEWPRNPFDGTPVKAVDQSGHFSWTKCGAGDGIYLGYGWDGSPIGEAYGNGC